MEYIFFLPQKKNIICVNLLFHQGDKLVHGLKYHSSKLNLCGFSWQVQKATWLTKGFIFKVQQQNPEFSQGSIGKWVTRVNYINCLNSFVCTFQNGNALEMWTEMGSNNRWKVALQLVYIHEVHTWLWWGISTRFLDAFSLDIEVALPM